MIEHDANVVDKAFSLLQEATRHALVTWDADDDVFPLRYSGSYSLAAKYRDYVVKHEDGLAPSAFVDLLKASAELDGLLATYYHGKVYHDTTWRREAVRRFRCLHKAERRIEKRLTEHDSGYSGLRLGLEKLLDDRAEALLHDEQWMEQQDSLDTMEAGRLRRDPREPKISYDKARELLLSA